MKKFIITTIENGELTVRMIQAWGILDIAIKYQGIKILKIELYEPK